MVFNELMSMTPYPAQLDKAELIINYTLSRLEGEESFAVVRIDTGSF